MAPSKFFPVLCLMLSAVVLVKGGPLDDPASEMKSKRQAPDCSDVMFANSSGFVSLGDYNLADTGESVCNFKIQPETQSNFSMDFYFCDCRLTGNSRSCPSDHVIFNNNGEQYCRDLTWNRYRVASLNGFITVQLKVHGSPACAFTYAITGSLHETRILCYNHGLQFRQHKDDIAVAQENEQNLVTQESSCGDVYLTNSTGYITTPNYPHNYTNNVICVYNFQPGGNPAIMYFSVCDCQLENSYYDYLQFGRNGYSSGGLLHGGSYTVWFSSGKLEVKFVSDGSVTTRGCKVAYSTRGSQYAAAVCLHPLPQEIPSWTTANRPGPQCSSVVLTNSSGFVSIDDYNLPDRYGTVCNFIIQPQAQSNFSMDFFFCNCKLKGGSLSCISDRFTFNNDDAKYCGTQMYHRYRVRSVNGSITVHLKLYGYSTFPSCAFAYAISGSRRDTRDLCYNHGVYVHPGKDFSSLPEWNVNDWRTSESSCGEVNLTNTTGYITTPNFPHNYSNNMICVYTIKSASYSPAVIYFSSCDCQIENSGYDYFQFGRNAHLVGGRSTGRTFVGWFEDGQLEVKFVSDGSVTTRGCKIAYSSRGSQYAQKLCLQPLPQEILALQSANNTGHDCSSVVLTNSSGFVSIDDYNLPDRYGTVCNFIIQPKAQSNFSVDVYFCDCYLQGRARSCISDQLTFNDGVKYCGSLSSNRFRVSSVNGSVTVQMKVYSYTTFPSCAFTYAVTGSVPETRDLCDNHGLQLPPGKDVTSLPVGAVSQNNTDSIGCGKTAFHNHEDYITTPNYPHNYSNNMNCVYRIRPTYTPTILYFFTCNCELESPRYDYIQLGRNARRIGGRLSRMRFLVWAEDDQYEIKFVSDGSVTMQGCLLAYSPNSSISAEQICPAHITPENQVVGTTDQPLLHINTSSTNNDTNHQHLNGTSMANNGTNHPNFNHTFHANNGTNHPHVNGTSPVINETSHPHHNGTSPGSEGSSSGCGKTAFHNYEDYITTPNYPHNYSNNMNCVYRIRTKHPLSYMYFFTCGCEMESPQYDYIQLGRNGQRIGGRLSRKRYLVWAEDDQYEIKFVSDGSVTMQGCLLAYSPNSSISAEQICPAHITPENQVVGTTDQPLLHINTSSTNNDTNHQHLNGTSMANNGTNHPNFNHTFHANNGTNHPHVNGTSPVINETSHPHHNGTSPGSEGSSSGCGKTAFHNYEDYITTPNYPHNYSNNMNCVYRIRTKHPLSYMYFFTCGCEMESPQYDYIQLGRNGQRIGGRLSRKRYLVWAEDDQYEIKFVSDGSVMMQGCLLAYSPNSSISAEQICPVHITPENQVVGTTDQPLLHINTSSTNNDTSHQHLNGTSMANNGTNHPNFNHTFHANNGTNHPYVNGTFPVNNETSHPHHNGTSPGSEGSSSGCGKTAFHNYEDYITTPNYPHNYSNNMNCVYRIRTKHPLSYMYFFTCGCEMESPQYDYIQLGRNGQRIGGRLSRKRYLVWAEDDQYEIKFVSDGSVTMQGCLLAYSPNSSISADQICPAHITPENQVVGTTDQPLLHINTSSTNNDTNHQHLNGTSMANNGTNHPNFNHTFHANNGTNHPHVNGTSPVNNETSHPHHNGTSPGSEGSSSGCGKTAFHKYEDYITTPNYPHNYSNNMNCVYRIRTKHPLSYMYFFTCGCEMESPQYDYIQLGRNGQRIGGRLSRKRYLVWAEDDQYEIKFVSDGSVTMQGCLLAYSPNSSISAEQICPAPITPEPQVVGTTGQPLLHINTSSTNNDTNHQHLNGTSMANNGTNHPNFNGTFHANNGTNHPHVNDTSPVKNETSHPHHNGTSPVNNETSHPHPNGTSPVNNETSLPHHNGTYPVNNATSHPHHNGTSPVNNETSHPHHNGTSPVNNETSHPHHNGSSPGSEESSSGCGKSAFHKYEDYITTPNYPHNYSNNMNCVYRIRPMSTPMVMYFFTCGCEMESPQYDYIQLGRNGQRISGRLSRKRYVAWPEDDQYEIKFVSDGSVTMEGCLLAYSPNNSISAEQICPPRPKLDGTTDHPLLHINTSSTNNDTNHQHLNGTSPVNNGTSHPPFNGTSPVNNGTSHQHHNGTSPFNNGTSHQQHNGTSPVNNGVSHPHHNGTSPVNNGVNHPHHNGTYPVNNGASHPHHNGTSPVNNGASHPHHNGTSPVNNGASHPHHNGTSLVNNGASHPHHTGTSPLSEESGSGKEPLSESRLHDMMEELSVKQNAMQSVFLKFVSSVWDTIYTLIP